MDDPITELPLAKAIDAMRGRGADSSSVSAVCSVTIGLSALMKRPAPLPLSLLEDWQGKINAIKVSRTCPGT